jgi:hypothetical protein
MHSTLVAVNANGGVACITSLLLTIISFQPIAGVPPDAAL